MPFKIGRLDWGWGEQMEQSWESFDDAMAALLALPASVDALLTLNQVVICRYYPARNSELLWPSGQFLSEWAGANATTGKRCTKGELCSYN